MKKINSILFFIFCTSLLFAQKNNLQLGNKTIKVFILSGQSNMVGWGEDSKLPDYLSNGDAHKLMFENGKWEILKPFKPSNKGQTKYGLSGNTFGPEISLAEEISKSYPNETIGIIKSSFGGTGILAWSPNWTKEQANRTNDGRKGDLYKVLIDKIKAAQKEANIEIVGFMWQQGGKDMTKVSLGKEYFDNLKFLIKGLRKDLDLPNLPVFIGCSVSKETLTSMKDSPQLQKVKKARPGVEHVISARFKAEQQLSNVKVVVTPNLEKHPKNVHYNTSGQLKLGEYYANTFLKFIDKI